MLDKERFNFGENWKSFLNTVSDENIYNAEKSLKTLLNTDSLKGKTFLDIGSGSGLFSLAARNLGAKVTSFDYDPESVECTKEMKRKFANGDRNWEVKSGSVLDKHFLTTLSKYDILYSWGVLHHTGDLWQALENITTCLKERGTLVISLYNDQGGSSRRWLLIKKIYNRLPKILRLPYAITIYLPIELRAIAIQVIRGKFLDQYINYIRNYKQESSRGMSWWHDKIDWLGGLPFEVSTPTEIFKFYKIRNFELINLSTVAGGHGCNEFVFKKKN